MDYNRKPKIGSPEAVPHEREQMKAHMAEKLAVLSQYFNDRIRTEGKKILVVPGWLVRDIDMSWSLLFL